MIVENSHPSLAGHFPGNPVVPGVVLLDRVIDLLAAHRGGGVTVKAMPNIKFLEPLLPDCDFDVVFQDKDHETVSFSMIHSGRKILTGTIKYTVQ